MSSSSKVIVLTSSDGETFELGELVALELQTIKYMTEDECADTVIPSPNVTSRILSKIIEYCNKPNVIVLKSSDNDYLLVDEKVALQFKAIEPRVEVVSEDGYADNVIPILNVKTSILLKVIEYCKKHVEAPKTEDGVVEEDLQSFDADFVEVNRDILSQLAVAADYLYFQSLLDLVRPTIPVELFKALNINA